MEAVAFVVAAVVGILLVLLATVGVLHVFRGRSVGRLVPMSPNLAPVCSAEFLHEIHLLTRSEFSGSNRYEVLLNGDGTYDRLCSDLRAAERSITIQQYYVRSGRLLDQILEVLTERAGAGVRVLVLTDAIGSKGHAEERLEEIEKAGAQVEIYRPTRLSTFGRADSRLHSRGVVIDGCIGYTGGFGFADCWLGDGRSLGSWRDTNVRFTGPAVLQLQAAFAAVWAEATGTLLAGDFFVPREIRTDGSGGTGQSALLHTPPGLGSTAGERFILRSLAGAKRRLFITNSYFVPDPHLVDLLVSLAQRGVDVRILTANELTDLPITRWAGRSRYEALLSGGVRIFEYQPAMMHGKTFVIDGCWSTIGALNLDVRSMSLNEETTLMVQDEELALELERIFEDDLTRSSEIELHSFRQRGLKERILESAAGLLTPVL